jgi:hypothetical protein
MVVNVVDRDQVGFGGQANAIRSFHIFTYVACALSFSFDWRRDASLRTFGLDLDLRVIQRVKAPQRAGRCVHRREGCSDSITTAYRVGFPLGL